jgi:alpha-L-fucosidase
MDQNAKMAWWRESRFGMFIHWGLYAEPAGYWQGQKVGGTGEWIMKRAKIPVAEYEGLAAQFNAVAFNADEWVALARETGMKSLTITAKHHDGFAMYGSKCSSYNIVDATPFGRDPMLELALACERQGIRFGLYYSHFLDWHHPHAFGNDWDYDEEEKDFSVYFEEKCLPQVRELLENYGDIAQLWFDGGTNMEQQYVASLVAMVRQTQPACIVSGRVGWGLGDFRSMGDNRVPFTNHYGDWDTPSTLNDTWSYTTWDGNWKTSPRLLSLLAEINSKGGNYLLNVGPDGQGCIPDQAGAILREVGDWMALNGESIHGTRPAPVFPYVHKWGFITYKPGKLFLHILDWQAAGRAIFLSSMANRVVRAYPLADLTRELSFRQFDYPAEPECRLSISLPAEPLHPANTVICLEVDPPDVVIEPLR